LGPKLDLFSRFIKSTILDEMTVNIFQDSYFTLLQQINSSSVTISLNPFNPITKFHFQLFTKYNHEDLQFTLIKIRSITLDNVKANFTQTFLYIDVVKVNF
jgi:hypothetical protein